MKCTRGGFGEWTLVNAARLSVKKALLCSVTFPVCSTDAGTRFRKASLSPEDRKPGEENFFRECAEAPPEGASNAHVTGSDHHEGEWQFGLWAETRCLSAWRPRSHSCASKIWGRGVPLSKVTRTTTTWTHEYKGRSSFSLKKACGHGLLLQANSHLVITLLGVRAPACSSAFCCQYLRVRGLWQKQPLFC